MERKKARALVKSWKHELPETPEEEVTIFQAPQVVEAKKVSGSPEAPGVNVSLTHPRLRWRHTSEGLHDHLLLGTLATVPCLPY